MAIMRKTVLWAMVLLVMVVTFYFSHEPATGSGKISMWMTNVISSGLEQVLRGVPVDWFFLHHAVRKGAHFFIYMTLGIFVFLACMYGRLSTYRSFVLTMIICIVFAISDEIHQVFVPGRSGEIRDVLIDGLGALLGILIVLSIKNGWKKGKD